MTDFLRRHAALPFVWGHHDCLMWLADWILEVRGIDPAAAWRGSYTTQPGALRVIVKAGGMVAHVERVVAPLGIRRTDEPARGDIAVVDAPEGQRGAIVLSRSVARHGHGGIVVQRLPIIAAWRV